MTSDIASTRNLDRDADRTTSNGTARLIAAMRDLRDGNFRRRVLVTDDGPLGELAGLFNDIAARNQQFASELARVRQATSRGAAVSELLTLPGVSGEWATASTAVNGLITDLQRPTAELSRVLAAVAEGDLSLRMPEGPRGEFGGLAQTVNGLLDQISLFAAEVTRVAREVGSEGRLGGQAEVPGVSGTWRDLTDSVNVMAGNLTGQVRSIAQVATAVARGDLSQKIDVDAKGEILELKTTLNTMVDQLSAFADEVTRVAREVGSEGRLGGQAVVPGVAGTWRDLTDSVNVMAGNLTSQVRNIAQVTTAVARGDLSQLINVDARGEILELKTTINTMVDQLSAFADEVTRVAREVGTEGKLGGQARVRGVGGTWKDLTDNVNIMADNLTGQVRSIATVSSAVAGGDLSKKITVEAKGEVAALADTINGMVDTLRAFADEVTRVAREVGTEGTLGGQARVPNVAGTWKDLTDNVNSMANNLTSQVRNIAQVTTAVAQGDLSRKIDVDARGEILELKTTINTMVDRLSAFAAQVTRVAREVGTEGKLGGQAEVEGVSGTWQRLTESVNQLASNLTTQVRAIAQVATAVTAGDLTRQITVDASGEVADLKDNINQMIGNLKETTRTNWEQDWLKTNLARISGLMQGHRDLTNLASLILSELAPLVSAQHGSFFLAHSDEPGTEFALERTANYGGKPIGADGETPVRFRLGESLVGQAAVDKRTVLVTGAPPDYVRVSSGLGNTVPVNVIVLPVTFEDQTLGVIELASVNQFTDVHRDLLEQLKEIIGVNVNTIRANSRTEALLGESQRLTQELRARSEQLQSQQDELQRSNTELAEKAALLASQNKDIEIKNVEIEQARQQLEERARQLSMASKYKSEFMANMSHELRTPLNSVLILAQLLADNVGQNLTDKQMEFARTIHAAGADLLQLINDILDLAKVEAGHMEVQPSNVPFHGLVRYLESLYHPLTAEKALHFSVDIAEDVPPTIETDEQRLQQILRNLLSNAVKFTDEGSVQLKIRMAPASEVTLPSLRRARGRVAFDVEDTGISIPADKLSFIFEAFQQADGTTNRKYGGTGLGLSISRELTYLLGGELKVDSQAGRGTVFTLILPLDAEHTLFDTKSIRDALMEAEPLSTVEDTTGWHELSESMTRESSSTNGFAQQLDDAPTAERGSGAPEAVVSAPERKSTASAPGSVADPVPQANGNHSAATTAESGRDAEPMALQTHDPRFHWEKVLVVDDDVRTVFALTTFLELHGLKVIVAATGAAGIRALREHDDIALVLMDVMMPDLDGNATIATIRRLPEFLDLPIIAVTAKAMKGDREKSLASGATDYVTKPVDTRLLLDLIAANLQAPASAD